jgi:solute carrier family 35 protein C2
MADSHSPEASGTPPPLPPPPPHITQSDTTPSASAFPQPTLSRPSTAESARSNESLLPPDAAAALAGVHTQPDGMEPESSGQRRRRSSLMNNINTGLQTSSKRDPKHRTPTSSRNSIAEEGKLLDSNDDMSTSDDVEMEEYSEEDDLQDDEETGLTGKAKSKRKRKRKRNTLLDQRVVADPATTAEEKKEADHNVIKKSLINGSLIALWYIFSLSISIVRSLPTTKHFPLLTSTVQQVDVLSRPSRF